MNHFCRHEDDAQRNHGFDRRARHMHPAHRRRDQRHAVRGRERGDRDQYASAAAHDQQQRKYEQQMIDAAEDVFDSQDQVDQAIRCVPVAAFMMNGGRPRPQTFHLTRAILRSTRAMTSVTPPPIPSMLIGSPTEPAGPHDLPALYERVPTNSPVVVD